MQLALNFIGGSVFAIIFIGILAAVFIIWLLYVRAAEEMGREAGRQIGEKLIQQARMRFHAPTDDQGDSAAPSKKEDQ